MFFGLRMKRRRYCHIPTVSELGISEHHHKIFLLKIKRALTKSAILIKYQEKLEHNNMLKLHQRPIAIFSAGGEQKHQ